VLGTFTLAATAFRVLRACGRVAPRRRSRAAGATRWQAGRREGAEGGGGAQSHCASGRGARRAGRVCANTAGNFGFALCGSGVREQARVARVGWDKTRTGPNEDVFKAEFGCAQRQHGGVAEVQEADRVGHPHRQWRRRRASAAAFSTWSARCAKARHARAIMSVDVGARAGRAWTAVAGAGIDGCSRRGENIERWRRWTRKAESGADCLFLRETKEASGTCLPLMSSIHSVKREQHHLAWDNSSVPHSRPPPALLPRAGSRPSSPSTRAP
jgi:hypothetical protein